MPLVDFDVSTLDGCEFRIITHRAIKEMDKFPAFSRWLINVGHSRSEGFMYSLDCKHYSNETLINSLEFCRYWTEMFYVMAGEADDPLERARMILLQEFCRAVLMELFEEKSNRERTVIEVGDDVWTEDIDLTGTNWVQG